MDELPAQWILPESRQGCTCPSASHHFEPSSSKPNPPCQIYARKGEQVFRDEVDWDANNPSNTALQYASTVCLDLGLDFSWFEAVSAQVQGQLDDITEVGCAARGEAHVAGLGGVACICVGREMMLLRWMWEQARKCDCNGDKRAVLVLDYLTCRGS